MVHDYTVRDRHQHQRQEQHSAGRHSWFLCFVALNSNKHTLTHPFRLSCSFFFFMFFTWPCKRHFSSALSFTEVRVWNLFDTSFSPPLYSFINSMSDLSRCCLASPPLRFAPFSPTLHSPIWIGCVINYTLSLLCVDWTAAAEAAKYIQDRTENKSAFYGGKRITGRPEASSGKQTNWRGGRLVSPNKEFGMEECCSMQRICMPSCTWTVTWFHRTEECSVLTSPMNCDNSIVWRARMVFFPSWFA